MGTRGGSVGKVAEMARQAGEPTLVTSWMEKKGKQVRIEGKGSEEKEAKVRGKEHGLKALGKIEMFRAGRWKQRR